MQKRNDKLSETEVIGAVRQMVANQRIHDRFTKEMRPLSLQDVADQFGTTRQAISYILTKNGLSVRSLRKSGESKR